MAPKKVMVCGDTNAGKKTLTATLVLKCGAGLSEIELIEKNNVHDYRSIAALLRQKGKPIAFHGPSSQYHITDELSTNVEVLLWVVDPTVDDRGESSCAGLKTLMSSGELKVEEQLIVVVNKMDLIGWSESTFMEIAHVFTGIGSQSFKFSIVPISSLHGDNMLEPFREAPWIQSLTASQSKSVVAQPLLLLL